MTPGQDYLIRVKRHRTSFSPLYVARYLGPDPERDGWLAFASLEQDGVLLRVEESVIDGEPVETDHQSVSSSP